MCQTGVRTSALAMAAWLLGMQIVADAAGNNATDLSGTWEGTYMCTQGETGINLELRGSSTGAVSGVVSFYSTENTKIKIPPGSYFVSGNLMPSGQLRLNPGEWKVSPGPHIFKGILDGAISADHQRYNGRVIGCGANPQFTIARSASRPTENSATVAPSGVAATSVAAPTFPTLDAALNDRKSITSFDGFGLNIPNYRKTVGNDRDILNAFNVIIGRASGTFTPGELQAIGRGFHLGELQQWAYSGTDNGKFAPDKFPTVEDINFGVRNRAIILSPNASAGRQINDLFLQYFGKANIFRDFDPYGPGRSTSGAWLSCQVQRNRGVRCNAFDQESGNEPVPDTFVNQTTADHAVPTPNGPLTNSRTIANGQTKEQVLKIKGPPTHVTQEGAIEIDDYPDMKITFVNNIVSDIE